MNDTISESWDSFLDAYCDLKHITLAYDLLLEEAINDLAKTKQAKYTEKLNELREDLHNGKG